ncbi:MAG: NHL repeat-containing protein [Pelagibacterales bacterium]|nr:NHL repeat-containing protein [Pelagibacterales bacterium]
MIATTKLIAIQIPDEVYFLFARGYVKELSGDLNGACADWEKAANSDDTYFVQLSKKHLMMPKCQNYSSPDNIIVDELPEFNKAGTTLAGGNGEGSASNQLSHPTGIALDASGNLYIADTNNHRIQKWTPGATEGITVAEDKERSRSSIITYPTGITLDASGNMYITDTENNNIKKWALGATEGLIIIGEGGTTDRGGYAANQLNNPAAITIDTYGNLYIADRENHRIQEWAPLATIGTTVARGLRFPSDVALDAAGNLYIADTENNRIQKWESGAREGTTVAGGNEKGSRAYQLFHPQGITLDASGNMYIADTENNRIQMWAPGAIEGTTIAGGNGEGSAANQLSLPRGITLDSSGNLYIADTGNNRIQKYAPVDN